MSRKIRILETIRQGQIGGGESHLLDLVDNLDKSEFEPVVLSFTDGPMIDRLRQMNVPTHVIPTTRPFDVTKWSSVRSFLQEKQIDLVHAHGTRAASNVFWASDQLRLPFIYTVHGWSFHQDQPTLVRQLRTLGERVLIKKADVTISVSASNRDTGKHHFPNFESVVINNGINIKRFNPANPFADIRAELGIPQKAVLAVFVARFTHQKQPLALLNAFAQVAEQNPDLYLLMVGDGEQKPKALQQLEQLSCRDRIIVSPARHDIPAVLSAADIYVLPSLWEGLPIALLEAMSMGKAVVASEVDGTVELIKNNVNGLLVSTASLEKEVARALRQLSSDEPLRNRLGNAARQTVASGFNAATMTDEVEKIYRQLTHKLSQTS